MKKKKYEFIFMIPIIFALMYEIYGMIKTYLNPMFNSYSLPELFLVTLPIVILFYLTNKNSKFRIYFYLYYIISIPVILLGLVINYFIIL